MVRQEQKNELNIMELNKDYFTLETKIVLGELTKADYLDFRYYLLNRIEQVNEIKYCEENKELVLKEKDFIQKRANSIKFIYNRLFINKTKILKTINSIIKYNLTESEVMECLN